MGYCTLQRLWRYVHLKTCATRRKGMCPVYLKPTLVPILPPHEVIHTIFLAGKSDRYLGYPTSDRCKAYWQCILRTPWGRTHPISEVSENDRGLCIPVHWHWDDVQIGRSSGGDTIMHCLCWSSALARGEVTQT